MKRILEILTYIDGGGAEMVVYNYLSHMNLSDFDIDITAIQLALYTYVALNYAASGTVPYKSLTCK